MKLLLKSNFFISKTEKGTHSVFTKASNLVEKPEFTNKSVSKTSHLGPFDINLENKNQACWIPKIIYVKKCLPIECEKIDKALSGKSALPLAPFEFSRTLNKILNSDHYEEENYGEGEGEGEEEEDNDAIYYQNAIKLNEVSKILSSITENPVIRKFLQSMCEYNNVLYSELEPSIIKGELKKELGSHSKLLSDIIECDDYFELMELTEYLTDDLDAALRKGRTFSKSFYLGILNDCFINNKIEVLPTYIRLFNSSFNYKNSNNLIDLIREGKLISLFYKGLYENKFMLKERLEEDEDEEMEDIYTSKNTSEKPHVETLLKKQFIEELEEVMNLHNGTQDISGLANKYISKELDYQNPIDSSFSLSDTLMHIATHLKYKNYPFVSELQSLLILLETTQGYDIENNEGEIKSLFKQKFGDIAESISFKCFE